MRQLGFKLMSIQSSSVQKPRAGGAVAPVTMNQPLTAGAADTSSLGCR